MEKSDFQNRMLLNWDASTIDLVVVDTGVRYLAGRGGLYRSL